MAVTFTATLFQAEGKNATGLEIPAEVITELGGGKKPKVKVDLNGYKYESAVGIYGTTFLLPVSQEHRAAAGVKPGDELQVTLELDTERRVVILPDDLKAALEAKEGALAAYEKLADSRRKEVVRQVNDAKTQETRERRIAKIVAELGA